MDHGHSAGLPGATLPAEAPGLDWPSALGGLPVVPALVLAEGAAASGSLGASLALLVDDAPGTSLAASILASLLKPGAVSPPSQPGQSEDGPPGLTIAAPGRVDALLAALAAAPAAVSGGGSEGGGGGASIELFQKGARGGGGGGPGAPPPPTTLTNNNGLTFVLNWDSSVGSAPRGFVQGVDSAAQYFLDNFSDAAHPTTITLQIGWGEVAGSRLGPGVLGESATNIFQVDFNALQQALQANLPAGAGPQGDPVSGTPHYYWAASAEQKALGLIANNASVDGAVGFGSNLKWDFTSTPRSTQYDFVGTAKHEISEVMGRMAIGGGNVVDNNVAYLNSYSAFDLFRFSDVGIPAPAGGSAAYFSYNNGSDSGAANLAGSSRTFFNTAAGGDTGDWASSAGNDAYNAFSSTGLQPTSGVDKLVMDALGYGKIT